MNLREREWNASYSNYDNYLFFPHEEIIRFVSKYIIKRVGLDDYVPISNGQDSAELRVLDVGCGIGRHVIALHSMGINSFGVDLSSEAIRVAKEWALAENISDIESLLKCGDICNMPWGNEFFGFAISHGVLDSMPFKIAKQACKEIARVLKPNALFYCDLVSGNDSDHAREYSGEVLVDAVHERGTIQSYFNYSKIEKLVGDYFTIEECIFIKREEVLHGSGSARYHLVLKKVWATLNINF